MLTTTAADPHRREAVEQVADVASFGDEHVDLAAALRSLRQQGVETALLEGGPSLNGAMGSAGLIDEWTLTSSPRVVGGSSRRIVNSPAELADVFELRLMLEEDSFLFTSYVRASSSPR